MNENFITKLETNNYLIGSFDAYIDDCKVLMKENSNYSDKDIKEIIDKMPINYRASILDKDNNFIGYIGLYNLDLTNSTASIRLEVNRINNEDKEEILEEYNNFVEKSLNINQIQEIIYKSNCNGELTKNEIVPKPNIIISNKLLLPGVSQETLLKFSAQYVIPNLQMPFTIKSNDRIIGIIGLSNVIWPNRRANLNIFLDKSLGNDIINELAGYIIDDYINYVHQSNIHSISLSVNGSNENLIKILENTKMNFYAQIPYSIANKDMLECQLMYQHIPNMPKNSKIDIPQNKSLSISSLDTEKKKLSEKIELDNGFMLISPKKFNEENIVFDDVLSDHIKALQNRDKFSIPLGEDKYMLNRNDIITTLSQFKYIIFDESKKYCGYIDIFRDNANGKNAEISIGLSPNLQHKGLGTIVINIFYEELFSVGYASVTSCVFEFNTPSIKLHEKVSQFNGIRLESYYINGKLWNMNYYTKINDKIGENKNERRI